MSSMPLYYTNDQFDSLVKSQFPVCTTNLPRFFVMFDDSFKWI